MVFQPCCLHWHPDVRGILSGDALLAAGDGGIHPSGYSGLAASVNGHTRIGARISCVCWSFVTFQTHVSVCVCATQRMPRLRSRAHSQCFYVVHCWDATIRWIDFSSWTLPVQIQVVVFLICFAAVFLLLSLPMFFLSVSSSFKLSVLAREPVCMFA